MTDYVTIPSPHVNHLGPNDTVASAYRDAARRLRGGYPAGGSNTCESIARTLDAIADVLEPRHVVVRRRFICRCGHPGLGCICHG